MRIFLVHAEEDYRFYDLLFERARSAKLRVEFANMPTKQPWVQHWKGTCRRRICQCDGAIVLLSERTEDGASIRTELEYIREADIPALIVYMEPHHGPLPEQVRDAPVIEWNWAGVVSFIQSLQGGPVASRLGT